MPLSAWQRAGEAHAAYSARRQVSGEGLPRRMLTDFLIGAHASTFGHTLLTLNTSDYGDFPEVPLLTVAQEFLSAFPSSEPLLTSWAERTPMRMPARCALVAV
ncbi:type II toxin-antitoxin system VapC family toxin [Deinococcus psychrotolerans]|uniref:type II toxin-antitoxin system VapC family toxin n=1 Tax=Deinococcus psychrotolerans TaxID=2489213 RepID=UPI0019D052CC|nr:type II toxin-antitoxin system VapC family toxin [Deinococcus psychrotolerans]